MSASEILFVTDQGVELYQVGKPGACRMKYKISLLGKPVLFTFKKDGRPLFTFLCLSSKALSLYEELVSKATERAVRSVI